MFYDLSDIIKQFPDEVQEAAKKATQESVDEYGKKMYEYLKLHGGKHLMKNILPPEVKWESETVYVYVVDWEDELVTPDRKYYKNKGRRAKGKRDFSKNPATWHDLAWILSTGRTIVKDNGEITIVPGTYFIQQGVRRKNGWGKKQAKLFSIKLSEIAKNLE